MDEIQIASFVSPRWVPGWADVEVVVFGIRNKVGVWYIGLWLNDKGFLRVLKVGGLFLKGIVIVVAFELFFSRNQNMILAQNAFIQRDLIAFYQENAVFVKWGSIHAAFGCNYQGDVLLAAVISSIREIQSIVNDNGEEIEEISLADTMGWAILEVIKRTVGAVRGKWPNLHIRLHLYDIRGLGFANVYAGLEMGVSRFDSSVVGLGGCFFVGHKGVVGNICIEDLVFLCEESGVGTNVDLG